MRLSDFLTDVGRPVAFYPSLVKALGDRNEAIFICQMAYWRGKGENKDDWIYKTSEEIEIETSLTYKEQTNVRTGLKSKKLLQERYARTEHQMYFRVDWDKINSIWEQFTDGHMPKSKVAVDQKEGGSLPEVISLNSNTESTAKNTTEKKQSTQKPDFRNLQPSKYRTIPELRIFMDATGWIPGSFVLETIYEFVHEGLTKEAIAAAFKEWTARSYKPGNVKGYLTWARDGIPAQYSSKAGEAGPKPAINSVAVEATKQLVDTVFSGNFVPRPANVKPPQIGRNSS